MSNNPNEVYNFEQLMRKYLKNNEQIINKYDYESPLKEISPIEPLLFQNDTNNYHNMQNIEPKYNNDLNKNIPNNINVRNNMVDNLINNNLNDNKFITPSKPTTKNISNINSFINSSIEREKEAKEEKKKKQLEYQKMLDEQIKEKQLRQKREREKRLQEELLFEEKLKLENEQYQQELNKIKKNKNMNNLFSPEEKNINPVINSKNFVLKENNISNNMNNNISPEQDIDENVNNGIINNDIRRVKSQPYLEAMNPNNIFEINKNQKYKILPPYIPGERCESQENFDPSSIPNLPQRQIPIEHLVSTSSQIPAQFSNQNQNHPQYKTQNNYYPSNRNFQNQSQNFIQNLNNINYQQQQSQPPQADLSPYLTQRQYYDYKQKLLKNPSDLSSNTNISITPSNFPSCYQIPFNNNLMNSSPNPVNFNNNSQNINDIFNMNINNQNYFGKIMEIFFHEQEKILENYKETIEKLKTERDEAIYKNKANEEKILALQKMQKDQEILEKNLGYFPFKNSYQQNMEKTLDSILQKNSDDNIKTINNKKDEQSLNNINNNSNVSDSKLHSLITSTKFVKVNDNDKHLLETWKKDDKSENNNDENNINNNINNNNKEDVKNKYKLNGMDTNAFMEKINLINNKILEPPDEPQNYLNDNNISIISKTQKNEDKSFANELININDKEEKNNINNINNINKKSLFNNKDLEEINNNIRDSDLSTQKFIVELQSKDFILNNVHNPIIQNLDNNISYSTQIKERLEEKRKQFNQNKNKNTKFDIISEKDSKLSHNFDDDEKKQKYQNYAFKQVKFSNSKENENNDNELENQNLNLKIIPGLKNIDNNIIVSTSKKNYSLFVSRHNNNDDNNYNVKEKNLFENAISINNEEENINYKNNIINEKINNEEKIEEIGEEINDIPNLDSPRNEYKKDQIIDIQKSIKDKNSGNINISQKNINSKEINKNEEDIIDRLNFFEDDNNISKIKLDKKESLNKKYNNINNDIKDSFHRENKDIINKKSNNNNIDELCNHESKSPNDLNGDKIASLNNLYDQYIKKKKEKLNETNNSMMNNNNIENNSLLNESLNTFTQNLNKKWKDLTKKDINNIKNNREQHYNNEDNYENNLSCLEDDKFEDEKIFDKVNQFTRVALNELKQSQLSVFSKDKTFKKYE